MQYAKPWEHPSADATPSVIMQLSALMNSSLAAQLLLLQSQQGYLAGHHLRISNVLEEFLNPVVNRFLQQTLPTINRKHFFMNILCIESFSPQQAYVERL
jgi:hypothetical protein